MIELIKWGKILYAILQDGKVTKAELPAFLEALEGFVLAVVTLIAPFLKDQAATIGKRLAGGIGVAALAVRK